MIFPVTQKIWLVWAASLLLMLVYPLSVLLLLGNDGLIWLRHNPAYNLYSWLVVPLIASLCSSAFQPGIIQGLQPVIKVVLFIVLAVFLFVISPISAFKIVTNKAQMIPHWFSVSAVEATKERELKAELHKLRKTPINKLDEESRKKAREIHKKLYPAFTGIEDFINRASITGYIALIVNFMGNALVWFCFWYLIVIAVGRPQLDAKIYDYLLLAVSLFILYFPIRFYSAWYQHYYDLTGLRGHNALIIGAIAAFLAVPIFVLISKPQKAVVIFAATNTTIAAVIGAMKQISPSYLPAIFTSIAEMDNFFFGVVVFLVSLVLFAFVANFLQKNVT